MNIYKEQCKQLKEEVSILIPVAQHGHCPGLKEVKKWISKQTNAIL